MDMVVLLKKMVDVVVVGGSRGRDGGDLGGASDGIEEGWLW